jgi:hypothetical protein
MIFGAIFSFDYIIAKLGQILCSGSEIDEMLSANQCL